MNDWKILNSVSPILLVKKSNFYLAERVVEGKILLFNFLLGLLLNVGSKKDILVAKLVNRDSSFRPEIKKNPERMNLSVTKNERAEIVKLNFCNSC